ncbi:hypothetical protein [Streptomyces althioticus]|nr:hypothetical protein OG872_32015 [Streptomyces althioticus]
MTPPRNEHEVAASTGINDIAQDLTIWMAARSNPERPSRRKPED